MTNQFLNCIQEAWVRLLVDDVIKLGYVGVLLELLHPKHDPSYMLYAAGFEVSGQYILLPNNLLLTKKVELN